MNTLRKVALWGLEILLGCTLFALGFDLFLEPNGVNAGGLSGLAMIVVHVSGFGTVGTLTILANIPLFILGWRNIGRKFFVGSLLGAVFLSLFLDLFTILPAISTEPILAALYGGLLCGGGGGLVFLAGASTGGSDIVVRLLKKRWKNIPIGTIVFGFDGVVVLLTGLVFQDINIILYCGITIFVCSKLVDAVVYSFDYSKVALIISRHHETIAAEIGRKLDRGATFLYGQGTYSHTDTKVILTAVKRQQLAELKALVVHIDPDAFIILQDSHQVLGDGFIRYTDNSL